MLDFKFLVKLKQPLMRLKQPRYFFKTKVFCIGFQKTGTSSLSLALKSLGYRVTGPNGQKDPNISKNVLPMAYKITERYDAFQDNPWPVIFKEMDARYPGSKFILTVRDPASWIRSAVNHFGYHETPMRQWIYGKGCPQGNEDTYLNRYNRHNELVLEYFKNRPHDLLVMDLSKGDGWEKLCSFLGCKAPKSSFPQTRKARKK